MNFCKWCMLPISDQSCFSVFGGSIFMIASVLRVVSMISCGLIFIIAMLFPLLRIRLYVSLWLGFLCVTYSVLYLILIRGSWVILFLWLLYRLGMHVPNGYSHVWNPLFFGMLLACLLIHRNHLWICMLPSRFLPVCWNCNVFVYPNGVVFGYMTILNLLSKNIVYLFIVLVHWFYMGLCPLSDLYSAFGNLFTYGVF